MAQAAQGLLRSRTLRLVFAREDATGWRFGAGQWRHTRAREVRLRKACHRVGLVIARRQISQKIRRIFDTQQAPGRRPHANAGTDLEAVRLRIHTIEH